MLATVKYQGYVVVPIAGEKRTTVHWFQNAQFGGSVSSSSVQHYLIRLMGLSRRKAEQAEEMAAAGETKSFVCNGLDDV